MASTHVVFRALAGAFRAALGYGEAGRPIELWAILTERCNLRCKMCNCWRKPPAGELSPEKWLEIFGEAKPLIVELVGGEPTLYPGLEVVAREASKGSDVRLVTNGQLAVGEEVLQHLRILVVSIDSPRPEVHDRIRGVRNAWYRATSTVSTAIRERGLSRPKVRINYVITDENYKDMELMVLTALSLGCDQLYFFPAIPFPGAEPLLSRDSAGKVLSLLPRVRARLRQAGMDYSQVYWLRMWLRNYYRYGYYTKPDWCIVPWLFSLVSPDGMVYPCCYSYMFRTDLHVGSLKEQSFTEIWHGREYRRIRKMLRRADMEMCRYCVGLSPYLTLNPVDVFKALRLMHAKL